MGINLRQKYSPFTASTTDTPRADESVLAHYEEVAQEAIHNVYRRSFLIIFASVAVFLATAGTLVMLGPTYTAESHIRLDFENPPSDPNARVQSSVQVEANNVVETIAKAIRSRHMAALVVDRLRLDQDSQFASLPIQLALLGWLREKLQEPWSPPSKRDVSINAVAKKVSVSTEPRSYIITISFSSDDPRKSARVVNTVAREYLREEKMREVRAQRDEAQRDFESILRSYDALHPASSAANARLLAAQARLAALEDEDGKVIELPRGQSLYEADPVNIPSGPQILTIAGAAAGVAMLIGAWLAISFPRRPASRA